MRLIATVYLKEGVLDPQGKAIHHALDSLGFNGVKDIRVGKEIFIELEESSEEKAIKEVEKMCEILLANTVIEDYKVKIDK